MAFLTNQKMQELQVKRFVLDKHLLGVGVRVPRNILRNMTVEQEMDHLTQDVLYRFESLVAAKTTTDTKKSSRVISTVEVPKTWWDHVKQRFAPEWFINRWPVQCTAIDTVIQESTMTTTTKICPHVDVPDNEREHFEWLLYEP